MLYRGWIVLAALGTAQDVKCPTAPEIMILQDSSSSLKQVHDAMSADIGNVLTTWASAYGSPVKLGFASFTDKPLPLRGWGGRAATGWADLDYCWDLGTSLTVDYTIIQDSFNTMTLREGGDFAEGQFEALLYSAVDRNVGFTDGSIKRDSEDRLVTRLAVIITDDASHLAGDAQSGIDKYNSPPQDGGYGGFGDFNFYGYQASVWQNGTSPYTAEDYLEYAAILYYLREGYDLLPEEIEQRKVLEAAYAPLSWDSSVVPHDGEFSDSSCKGMDYPSLAQVKAAVEESGIIPVVLVTKSATGYMDLDVTKLCSDVLGYAYDEESHAFVDRNNVTPCLVWWYRAQFEAAGITAVVGSFENAEDVVEAVKEVVLQSSDLACDLATSTEEPSEPIVPPTEPTEPTEPTVPTTEEPTVPTTEEPTVPTTEEPTTEEPTVPTTEEPTVPTTEEPTVPTTEEPTVPTTEEPTVPTTEEPTVPTTEEPTVPTTEEPTVPTTEEPTVPTTEEPTVPTTEEPTVPTTEEPTVPTTEEPTVPTTEEPTDPVEPTTEEPTEPIVPPTDETGPVEPTDPTEPTDPVDTTEKPTMPTLPTEGGDDEEDDEGSNAGVIAGATGGAVAGVAAVAGILYKSFGASLFGNSSTPDLSAAEQVNAPENPLEREGMEEVTMDMFQ